MKNRFGDFEFSELNLKFRFNIVKNTFAATEISSILRDYFIPNEVEKSEEEIEKEIENDPILPINESDDFGALNICHVRPEPISISTVDYYGSSYESDYYEYDSSYYDEMIKGRVQNLPKS